MPIFFQQDIDADTRLGIWKIEEEEAFFLQSVAPQREVSHPHKKLQHLAGRYLLRALFPDFPTSLIRVADTRKPFLENEAYHFSISHCDDYAAAIVSRKERVGVDIEVFNAKVERIKKKFLHPEELAFVEELSGSAETVQIGADRAEEIQKRVDGHIPGFPVPGGGELGHSLEKLTLLWSCKEAVYKWWSYGQVDFSEQIRISPFHLDIEGEVPASFRHGDMTSGFNIRYRLFDRFCLAWVNTGRV
jgi:phosphopantetheinyl transferase